MIGRQVLRVEIQTQGKAEPVHTGLQKHLSLFQGPDAGNLDKPLHVSPLRLHRPGLW
jgi:hypothetical protein